MFSQTGRPSARPAVKGLPDINDTTQGFLHWIGAHADAGTAHILRCTLARASESDIAQVAESMRRARPRNRAAWVVGALKSARAERKNFS